MNHFKVNSKPYYTILDGFRGIAAIMVLWYHIFEAFATNSTDQIINHGYLAVDFFFLLSGFVIAHTYNDRWNFISVKNFFKRRIIRLQPMLVMGSIIGAIIFYIPKLSTWKTENISLFSLIIATIQNIFLIPSTPTSEIRGLGEMFPLNGPSWSLFFEYFGYIFYVFILRKFSTKILSIWTTLLAFSIGYFVFFNDGYLGVGWTMDTNNIIGGSLRILFSFSVGMLLVRIFQPIPVKNTFFIGALVLIILTAMPRIGLWNNTFYDLLCIFIFFPSIIFIGASNQNIGKTTTKICNFLGSISYPLYLVHYPFIYWYYAWVKNNNLSFSDSIFGALGVVFGSIILAYILLKFYDEPIRNILKNKFLTSKK